MASKPHIKPWKTGDVKHDAQWIADAIMHQDGGLTVEQDFRLQGLLTLDIPRLFEQFETMRSQAEEIITLRDASVAKRTVWLAQWGEAGWSADLGRAVANPARES